MTFMGTEVTEQAKPIPKAPECPSALAAFFPRGPCSLITNVIALVIHSTPLVRVQNPPVQQHERSHVSKTEQGKLSASFGITKMCGC